MNTSVRPEPFDFASLRSGQATRRHRRSGVSTPAASRPTLNANGNRRGRVVEGRYGGRGWVRITGARMTRYATIDIGTNTVLLLVAEGSPGRPDAQPSFEPLVERAEITRLGRGVDRTGRLAARAIEDTADVVARFAAEARGLGAREIACVAAN